MHLVLALQLTIRPPISGLQELEAENLQPRLLGATRGRILQETRSMQEADSQGSGTEVVPYWASVGKRPKQIG